MEAPKAIVEVNDMKNEGYWALFCQTGVPVFYLTYRMEDEREWLV